MQTEQINNEEQLPAEQMESKFKYFPFFNQKQPVFVLVLLGIIFYCTSLYNEYALDDGIIIHQNNYVLKGVSGISDILSKDAYDSFYRRMNAKDQLQGGRYRPLPVISFAIEQEIIGAYRTGNYMFVEDLNHNGVLDNEKLESQHSASKKKLTGPPTETAIVNYEFNEFVDLNKDGVAQQNECNTCWDTNKNFKNDAPEDLNHDGVFNEVDCQVKGAGLRHFNNIWTYILACVLLYLVFRNYIFKQQPDMAFLAALIFLIHPVHSEIVANVKGREDIFSVIFIALTFLFSFKYNETKKISLLIFAGLAFFLALLSKEYAIVLLFLVPLSLYVFEKEKIKAVNLGLLSVCLFFFGAVYTLMRLNAVNMAPGVPDTEILNNPFLLATGEEKFASKIFILLKYLKLSFLPNKLTCDYSYAQIPYSHFADGGFISSLIINLALLVFGIVLCVKRHVLGFAIIVYFAFLVLVINFIFPVGALLREGFLFHASIGVAIAIAWVVFTVLEKMSSVSFITKRTLMISSLLIVLVLCGSKTWERNWDWKNDITLFLKDVKTSPNSVLILGNAGARWIDLADTKEVTGIALEGEDPEKFNDYNGQLKITDEEVRVGNFIDKRDAAIHKGMRYLKHAVELHPRYVNGYLNLGLASFKLNNDRDAIFYWKLAERLYPNNPYLENYYRVYSNILKNRGANAFNAGRNYDAAVAYKMCTLILPNDAEGWYGLGGAFYHLKLYHKAKSSWEKTLKLDPDHQYVGRDLKTIPTK
ncbi:MAG: glycosyltransferase family 39 protein [Bacteroidetes bacterium]|nr:glycosyltransferase family 39 protein [Bacteroidota bacterium]